ncbi:MAG: hypothetical protein KUG82_06025 [Pseudomonadales bacterium]|nr:hypothetical protein [Pseudomonadales bacterium]
MLDEISEDCEKWQESQLDDSVLRAATGAVELVATSMLTPIGINTVKSAAAVRAGIDAFDDSRILDNFFETITAATIPEGVLPPLVDALKGIPFLSGRHQRLLRLLTLPLKTIADQIQLKEPLILKLALPDSIPCAVINFDNRFLDWVAIQTEVPIDLDSSALFPLGRAGGIAALNSGMVDLEEKSLQQVVVGGVDSFVDLGLLASLDKEKRINGPGIMDGFIPGEAASFFAIQSSDLSPRNGVAESSGSPLGKIIIHSPGLSTEPGHRYCNTEPYKGEGLATAVSQSLESSIANTVQTVLCTFNGESFSSKEWGVTSIRNRDSLADNVSLHHPAEYFGEIGAAFAPVLIGLASVGLEHRYYQNDCLVWCSSDTQLRSAVRVTLC